MFLHKSSISSYSDLQGTILPQNRPPDQSYPCNEVYVALGFQELPQPEADYENVGMQKIISTVGDVESDSTWTKKILEWLSNGIFGKMIQLKREVPSTAIRN